MKSTQKGMNRRLKVFIGWVLSGFAFGFIAIGELVMFAHWVQTGEYEMLTLSVDIYFGIIFTGISFIPAIIAVSEIINIKNRHIARLIFCIFLIIISVCSIFWGTIKYQEIITYGNKVEEAYPWSIYIVCLFMSPFFFYIVREKFKRGEETEAILRMILYGLLLLIVLLSALGDIFS